MMISIFMLVFTACLMIFFLVFAFLQNPVHTRKEEWDEFEEEQGGHGKWS